MPDTTQHIQSALEDYKIANQPQRQEARGESANVNFVLTDSTMSTLTVTGSDN